VDERLVILGETERLLLRAPREGDLELIADLWADPVVTEYLGGPRERGLIVDSFREYAQDIEGYVRAENERWWSIFERTSGDFVGLCDLEAKDIEGTQEMEVGYYLLTHHWGRGYATEAAELVVEYAFSDLGLDSAIAIIDPRNERSAAVARKLGMGLEREVLRPDGVMRQVWRVSAS
jgi:RimJ/RimL family protein N-acetyltransferase